MKNCVNQFPLRCTAHSTSTACRRGDLNAYLAYAYDQRKSHCCTPSIQLWYESFDSGEKEGFVDMAKLVLIRSMLFERQEQQTILHNT